MPGDILQTAVTLASNNWMTLLGLATLGGLLYWWFDEREDAEDAAETVERVGRRAESVTGGLVGGFGSLLVMLASIGITIGNELLQTGAMLNEILGGAPVLVGHLLFGVITFLGLQGVIPGLTVLNLGYAFFVITIVALLLRYGSVGQEAS